MTNDIDVENWSRTGNLEWINKSGLKLKTDDVADGVYQLYYTTPSELEKRGILARYSPLGDMKFSLKEVLDFAKEWMSKHTEGSLERDEHLKKRKKLEEMV